MADFGLVLLVSVMISKSFTSSPKSDGTSETINDGADKLDGDNGDTMNDIADKLDDENLLNMGTQLKMQILRLLGRTLIDHECRYNPCTDWSKWSPCSARRHKFGVKSRSRECNSLSYLYVLIP